MTTRVDTYFFTTVYIAHFSNGKSKRFFLSDNQEFVFENGKVV